MLIIFKRNLRTKLYWLGQAVYTLACEYPLCYKVEGWGSAVNRWHLLLQRPEISEHSLQGSNINTYDFHSAIYCLGCPIAEDVWLRYLCKACYLAAHLYPIADWIGGQLQLRCWKKVAGCLYSLGKYNIIAQLVYEG